MRSFHTATTFKQYAVFFFCFKFNLKKIKSELWLNMYQKSTGVIQLFLKHIVNKMTKGFIWYFHCVVYRDYDRFLNNQLKLATGYIYTSSPSVVCACWLVSLCKSRNIFPRMKDDVIIKTSVRTR